MYEYYAEYSPSNIFECHSCKIIIAKGDVRIGQLLNEQKVKQNFNSLNYLFIFLIHTLQKLFQWYHAQCFLKTFNMDLHEVSGINDLRWEDLSILKKEYVCLSKLSNLIAYRCLFSK